jgi:uncharacterized membrane protein
VRSSTSRRQLAELLADSPFGGVDIPVETALTAVHAMLLATAAACVTAIVLAVFVLRQHNASRIWLTVLGAIVGLLALVAGLTGVLVAIYIAYVVLLLWKPEARSWFARARDAERSAVPAPRVDKESPMAEDKPSNPESEGREDDASPGSSPPQPQPYGQQQPYGQPQQYGQQGGYGYGATSPFATDPHKRPGTVVTALVLTWVGVAVMLVLGAGALAVYDSRAIIDDILRQAPTEFPVSAGEVSDFLQVTGIVLLVWGLATLMVSIFAWRRANWARIVLSVMAVLYIAFQMFTLINGNPTVLVPILWVVAIIVLLWVPQSRQWYAGKNLPNAGYGAQPNQPW